MNPFSLENKTILITGASSGIGRSIAVECSKMGARIIIVGRNSERLSETYNMLCSNEHIQIVADIDKHEDIDALVNALKNDNILEYSDLKLDLSTGKMSSNGSEISINGKELELLEILLLNKNQIISKEALINKIWGYDSNAEYNYVEVYASFLRKKLKILKSKVKIKAVRGMGYKLEEEDD